MPRKRLTLREDVFGAIMMLKRLECTNPSVRIDRMDDYLAIYYNTSDAQLIAIYYNTSDAQLISFVYEQSLCSWFPMLHLAQTKRVSVTAQDRPCPGTAARAGTLALLAMNATAVSNSVQTDHVIAYSATNLVQSLLRTCAVSGKPVVALKRN